MVVNIMKYLPKSASFSVPCNTRRNFSGPIVSIVPQEARGRKNYQAFEEAYEEPTSPKVSCIGQVMNQKESAKKKAKKTKKPSEVEEKATKPVSLVIRRMFQRKIRRRRKEDHGEVVEAPVVGNMRRYSSSRDTLKDFDWRNYGYEEEVLVPHSAPILVGGRGGAVSLEPKKEVNLWKRRTFVPPTPIEVKTSI